MLWACILLPQLALDGVLRRHAAPDEPLVLVDGPVQRQEARAIGFGFLNKVPIPSSSSAVAALQRKDNEIVESSISSNEWFPNSRRSTELWEESINLGYNKRVLTLLSWQNYEN